MATLFDNLRPTIQERFEAFHRLNPHVFTKLVELAREAKACGMERIGIGCLWERLRWYGQVELAQRDGSGWLLDNHYRSRYARLLVSTYPKEFGGGFFELRELKAD